MNNHGATIPPVYVGSIQWSNWTQKSYKRKIKKNSQYNVELLAILFNFSFKAFSVALILESQSWASVEVHSFIAEQYRYQVNGHWHFKAFKCCNTHSNTKMKLLE